MILQDVVIPTKGCIERMHTMSWIRELGLNLTVFTHNEEDQRRIQNAFPWARVWHHNIPHSIDGMTHVRDYIDKWIGDKWYLTIDDNIQYITGVPVGTDVDHWRFDPHDFDCHLTPPQIMDHLLATIAKCQELGNTYGGFTDMANGAWRKKQWGHMTYVKGCMTVMKPSFKFHQFSPIVNSDMARSVMEVAENGSVTRNSWMRPVKTRFEAGGIGSFEERIPAREYTYERLMEMYPGLLRLQWQDNHNRNVLRFSKRQGPSFDKWQDDYKAGRERGPIRWDEDSRRDESSGL